MIDGTWLSVKRTDERAFALYRRHYSATKGARWRRPGNTNVTSAGETMVLLSQCGRALFVWLRCTIERDPGRCFLRAGWLRVGESQTGLILLAREMGVTV